MTKIALLFLSGVTFGFVVSASSRRRKRFHIGCMKIGQDDPRYDTVKERLDELVSVLSFQPPPHDLYN